jgi:TetR/AcrR family transcriptional regulator
MENVEDKILHAAMKVFAENRYNGATTMKFAKEADVNEITIFRKFQSKENLLKAAISKYHGETLEILDSILCQEKSADIEICVKTLEINFKRFLENRIDFVIMLMAEGRKRPDISQLLTSFINKMIEHLKDYFQKQMDERKIRNLNPDVLAFSIFSFIFYKCLSEKLLDQKVLNDDEKAFEEHTDILMIGILNFKD